MYLFWQADFTQLPSYSFLPITFQDSACFPPEEAISLHAPNQNVSSAVTDGWIWVSCGKLMNNIYHLISESWHVMRLVP